jgi:hypothetical protein
MTIEGGMEKILIEAVAYAQECRLELALPADWNLHSAIERFGK